MVSQNAAQVVQSCFGSRVGKRLQLGDAQAVDGTNVYDACGRGFGGCGGEERGYGLGEEEDAFEVQRYYAVPGCAGVGVV